MDFEHIEEGHIIVEGDRIVEIGDGFESGGLELRDYLAVPALFNAHTHLGDAFAKEAFAGLRAEEAVGKRGKKWELYKSSRRDERVEHMRSAAVEMLHSGTTGFADFREFSERGVEELREAIRDLPLTSVILGRDLKSLDDVDGLGLNVWQLEQAEGVEDKFVVVHAGEAEGEVTEALRSAARIDALVHLTLATREELEEVARRGIAAILCPRSNASLRVGFPMVREMLDLGIEVALGTDNVAVNSPNLWREMEFLYKTSALRGEVVEARKVLEMVTSAPARIFGLERGCIKPGFKADLLFLDLKAPNLRGTTDLLTTLVTRVEVENVRKVMVNGEFVVDRDLGRPQSPQL